MKKLLTTIIVFSFLLTTLGPLPAQADEFQLPVPGVRIHLSPPLNPPILKGIKIHPDNPFNFEFILDQGDNDLNNSQIKDESSKLIKYFLASLTIPEKDLWVNLSPYEKDRIIPSSFGLTEMGRDLLAEDYMLKQITASLIYPEDEVGKKFWKRIYEEAAKRYGTTNISVNTFNKVWIVPEKAVIYENAKVGTAYVVESKLKVMLEQDYLSLAKHAGIQSSQTQTRDTNQLGSQIVREIVIPEISREVNENKNFVRLRQVYNSLILATWYKKKIRDSILEQVYADKNKTAGVQYTSTILPTKAGIHFKNDIEGLYKEYLRAFKKGVYNYIKEDIDPITQETIPRKYFSGGADFAGRFGIDNAISSATASEAMNAVEKEMADDHAMLIEVNVTSSVQQRQKIPVVNSDKAMRGAIARVKEGIAAALRNSFPTRNFFAKSPLIVSHENTAEPPGHSSVSQDQILEMVRLGNTNLINRDEAITKIADRGDMVSQELFSLGSSRENAVDQKLIDEILFRILTAQTTGLKLETWKALYKRAGTGIELEW